MDIYRTQHVKTQNTRRKTEGTWAHASRPIHAHIRPCRGHSERIKVNGWIKEDIPRHRTFQDTRFSPMRAHANGLHAGGVRVRAAILRSRTHQRLCRVPRPVTLWSCRCHLRPLLKSVFYSKPNSILKVCICILYNRGKDKILFEFILMMLISCREL